MSLEPTRSSAGRKILFVTQYLGMGGLERMILNLATGLQAQGLVPMVFVYDSAPNMHRNLKELFEQRQIPVIEITKGKGFSFRVLKELIQLIWKEKPVALHSHDIGALIYSFLAKIFSLRNPKLIHTQQSLTHHALHPRYVIYDKLFFRGANRVVVVSDHLAHQYKKLNLPARLFTSIPNGVEFSNAPLSSVDQLLDRREHLLKRDFPSMANQVIVSHPWILYLARIHPGKGQPHALLAWAQLTAAARQSTQLLVIGAETYPDYLSELIEKARNLPDRQNIHFMGPTEQPQDWLSVADLYLSCSEYEGMPLGPIEAVGSGVTTLLSDIPGHQLLKNHAILMPNLDPVATALAIEQQLNALKQKPSGPTEENWINTKELRTQYSVKTMADRYEKLYG